MLAFAGDIGGTNTRLGLVRDGVLLSGSTGSYTNDDFEFLCRGRGVPARAR